MFEGLPDQFHQFIASRTSLPLPLSFPPLHGSPNTTAFPSFDPYSLTSSSSHQQVPLQPNFLHPLHQGSSTTTKNDQDKEENPNMVAINLEIQSERSIPESVDPSWSNDEVLALLRIRSGMENWFHEFTWEHVSRKLAELGFKRSGEKCKEKFEEESRYFNNNINYNKNNYRVIFGDFDEEIYHGHDHQHQNPHEVAAEIKDKKMDNNKTSPEEEEDSRNIDQTVGKETEDNVNNVKEVEKPKKGMKRNREKKKFEMFKVFFEEIVKKIMSQQEEMHNKLLEDMVKRDEQKFAREETWKKQEMDRINKELEVRAQEQALVVDRHATIINFLRKFTGSSSSDHILFGEGNSAQDRAQLVYTSASSNPSTSSSSLVLGGQNPNPTFHQAKTQQKHDEPPTQLAETQIPQNPSPTLPPNITQALAPQNTNSLKTQNNPSTNKQQTKSTSNEKDDLGKRWPKDEVLALVNLRCNLYNNNEDKEGAAAKTPLWESISRGMLELGYKRSAKRCKEKWENINKYFRKTKDVNKKRSVDCRTCPYFHQLSTLYNQGVLISPSDGPENRSGSPQNHPTDISTSPQKGSNNSTTHVGEAEKNMVQVPGFDFEF